jgi:hypothetical protein
LFWGVPPYTASWQLHKVIPIVSLFATTSPEFFKVMKNWLPFVIVACRFTILVLKVVFAASLVDTSVLALFCNKLFFLFGFDSFFFLLLLLHL